MTEIGLPNTQRHNFSEEDFRQIASTAKSIFGLHLELSKKTLIHSRLSKRILAAGARSVSEYCEMVREPSSIEKGQFISALTTNVTHFYREKHHFDYLEKEVLPNLINAARHGSSVRIWSAGCSRGQEAYSLAGSLLSIAPDASNLDIKIVATDIDQTALTYAIEGDYGAESCRFDDVSDIRKVFPQRAVHSKGNQIRRELKEIVQFQALNLIEKWRWQEPFDIIFCRNVAIYFDSEEQSRLWDRFCFNLKPGGFLFIGHSERIHGPALTKLKSLGITTYRLT